MSRQLAMAFDAGDVTAAEELADQVAPEGAAAWRPNSALEDMNLSIAHTKNPETKDGLSAVLQRLQSLL